MVEKGNPPRSRHHPSHLLELHRGEGISWIVYKSIMVISLLRKLLSPEQMCWRARKCKIKIGFKKYMIFFLKDTDTEKNMHLLHLNWLSGSNVNNCGTQDFIRVPSDSQSNVPLTKLFLVYVSDLIFFLYITICDFTCIWEECDSWIPYLNNWSDILRICCFFKSY